MRFYQKTCVKLLSTSKVQSLSSIWKDKRKTWLGIVTESCRVGASCGGNISFQILSRALKLIAVTAVSQR